MVNTNNNFFSLSSREAAEDAGFNVLRVISQPAAAALAYGNLHWPFSDMCCEGARIACWFVSFVIHVQYSSLESRNLDCEQSKKLCICSYHKLSNCLNLRNLFSAVWLV